jgi:hypothetical protein
MNTVDITERQEKLGLAIDTFFDHIVSLEKGHQLGLLAETVANRVGLEWDFVEMIRSRCGNNCPNRETFVVLNAVLNGECKEDWIANAKFTTDMPVIQHLRNLADQLEEHFTMNTGEAAKGQFVDAPEALYAEIGATGLSNVNWTDIALALAGAAYQEDTTPAAAKPAPRLHSQNFVMNRQIEGDPAFAEVSSISNYETPRDLLEAIRRAVNEWGHTPTGDAVIRGTNRTFNIGDLYDNLGNIHLVAALKNHGIEQLEIVESVSGMVCINEGFDKILL